MHFSTLSLLSISLSTLSAVVHAAGNATVTNLAADPIYVYSVGSSVSPVTVLATNQTYLEPLHYDPTTGGIAIKVTAVPDGIYNGSPQLSFQYTLDGNTVWYDLANTYGEAFPGSPLAVTPSDPACGTIDWPAGVPTGGSSVDNCQGEADIGLTVGPAPA